MKQTENIFTDTGKISTPESSNIASFNYISARSVFIVEYKNKAGAVVATWEYDGVPPEIYAEACKAESIGKFVHSRVVGYYEGRKLEL